MRPCQFSHQHQALFSFPLPNGGIIAYVFLKGFNSSESLWFLYMSNHPGHSQGNNLFNAPDNASTLISLFFHFISALPRISAKIKSVSFQKATTVFQMYQVASLFKAQYLQCVLMKEAMVVLLVMSLKVHVLRVLSSQNITFKCLTLI